MLPPGPRAGIFVKQYWIKATAASAKAANLLDAGDGG
jgi:hypothetical protein